MITERSRLERIRLQKGRFKGHSKRSRPPDIPLDFPRYDIFVDDIFRVLFHYEREKSSVLILIFNGTIGKESIRTDLPKNISNSASFRVNSPRTDEKSEIANSKDVKD